MTQKTCQNPYLKPSLDHLGLAIRPMNSRAQGTLVQNSHPLANPGSRNPELETIGSASFNIFSSCKNSSALGFRGLGFRVSALVGSSYCLSFGSDHSESPVNPKPWNLKRQLFASVTLEQKP